jgi:hypothetical protein
MDATVLEDHEEEVTRVTPASGPGRTLASVTIGRFELGASDFPPEHVQLVAEHENLDLLALLRTKLERQQLEQAPKRPVQKRQGHAEPSF